jgi:hypothetical protein
MPKNRFEQVDEVQSDAITLGLTHRDGEPCGTVTCPAGLTGGQEAAALAAALADVLATDRMPAKDAFRAAIRLANEIKAAIVVVDPDALWQPEWGDLYRAV